VGRGPTCYRLRLVVALALVWATGCQATVRVAVDTRPNGSGTVTATLLLDPAAVRSLPGLGQQLRTADLQKDGWTVSGPTPTAGGGEQVSLTKSFAVPAQAAQVLAELTGTAPGGLQPFRDFRIDQRRAFASTTTSFHGTVDLTCGLSCFSDTQLHQLGADAIDTARLRQQTGTDITQAVSFAFGVHLPGTLRSTDAPTHTGTDAEWQVRLGGTLTMDAQSRVRDNHRLDLLVLAVAASVAAVVVGAFSFRRRRESPAPAASE
jgi:hypothetical protein